MTVFDVTTLPELPQKLRGKVAIVTGSARGLGRAYALRLARLGADVVVNDLDLRANREYDEDLTPGCVTVVDEIRTLDRRALGIEADVTDATQVQAMVDRTIKELGSVDVLVCNAGGALFRGNSNASEMPMETFHKMMDLNLNGTIHACQAVAPQMKSQKSGKIVTVSSQAGLRSQGGGGGTPYAVAKAAIAHYTRKLADELGPHNVTVNCIAPGWILSSRAVAGGRATPESRARLEQEIALKRLGEPEDCAKVVEFLSTDLSDYVTGQIIPICGGVCMF
ncbi:MAG: 3-oxoacyl-[acyl-carrier protein] reductase [uncultured Chloroflexi bacterium]|uniref:3-oxoacyl-[acyl-carrier protein] reductase n=1 Tax=uncultured Chloroflexota bacterium TaxID=166587 RepID=A0A6J4IPV3_9CHLR|nr:MAG: 3-oxoacyl-[acyl-carrier protein] reductase [uncultured Chloroflexota bacterium]